MKKSSIILVVLVLVSPVLAATANFFDSFEYADGTGDPAYANNWSVISGANRYPIATRIYQVNVTDPGALNGTKVAMAATPAPSGGYGIKHNLGAPVEATNASPLVVNANWHSMATNTNRQLISYCMELSQGDYHVPAIGSAPLTTPIPAIAFAVGTSTASDFYLYKFFNGTQWTTASIILWAGYKQWNWQHITMTFTDLGTPETQTGKSVAIHSQNEDLSVIGDKTFEFAMPSTAWTGGEYFDTFSFRAFDGMSFNSCIDSVSISGGEIVPEPATLALLGLALPLLRRRRRA